MLDTEERNEKFNMKGLIDGFFSVIPGMESAAAVPVLDADAISEKDFKTKWVSKNRPCLIKGAVKHWPAVQKWKDKDYWTANCENFNVAVYPHMNYNDRSRQKMLGGQEMSFYEAMERLFLDKDDIISMPGEKITENNRFSALLKDLSDFCFLTASEMPRMYERRRFFIYRRAATAWHYHDIDETLMCQINGAKLVGLLPPNIPKPDEVSKFLLEDRHLNGEALDRGLDLKPMIVNVEEGDALYIPPYWHHGVVPNDHEIGFTLAFCWRSPTYKLGEFSNYFVRKLYRDGIWPLRKETPIIPFLAAYAGILRLFRIAIGKG